MLRVYILLASIIGMTFSNDDVGLVMSVGTNPGHMVIFQDIVDKGTITPQKLFIFNEFKAITGLASDPRNGNLFIYDATLQRITRMSNFNIWLNKSISFHNVQTDVSNAIGRIAFDWITGNLYWTDIFYKWIGMKPAYPSDSKLHVYNPVLYKDIDRPFGLALDPKNGYLFWSDVGRNTRIERATLAGGDRKTLVFKSLVYVSDLSVDTATKTVYWADNNRYTIESSNYDGQNRRVICRKNFLYLRSLDFYKDKIYVASYSYKYVIVVDAKSGDSKFYNYDYLKSYAVHIFDRERYPVQIDPCKQVNCQHMCANTPSGPKCLCELNYRLKADNRTCEASVTHFHRSIIATNSSNICLYNVNLLTTAKLESHCYAGNGNVGPIAPAVEGVYYARLDTSEINFMSWNGTVTTKVSQTGTVSSLLYTWTDNLLFWIDTGTSTIKMRDLSFTVATSNVLYKELILPSDLTMDQHGRTFFWINGYPDGKTIMKGNTTGSKSQVLLGSGSLSDPKDVFYDSHTHRLFFIDNGKLKSINVDGSGLYAYGSSETGNSFLIYKAYALWTDGTGNLYSKQYNSTGVDQVMTGLNSIKEITIYDVSTMTQERGPCIVMNGGCEHICLPDNDGSVCKCEHGFNLQSDGKSCDSDPVHTGFAIVSDYTHSRLYQIPLSGATEIAIDIPGLYRPVCAVYDNVTQTVIWAEVHSGRIMSSDLHGNNVSLLYSLGNVSPDRFAIDTSSDSLYYTAVQSNTNKSYIGVLKMKGLANKKLVLNLDAPRAIALYPSKGLMFWTDHGHTPHIGRAEMDGSSIIKIQPPKIKWPNGIAIDFKEDKIYWTDGYYDTIERSDLSGENQQSVAVDDKAWLVDIVVMGPYLYYTAWDKRIVTKMEKDTGKIVDWMTESPELGRLDSIDLFPGQAQPINEICAIRNGQCSTFCFPKANGFSCGCPDGKALKDDGRTCEGVTLCPSDIPNGKLSTSCLRYVEETCEYSCKSGYRKRAKVDAITCSVFGTWDNPVDELCEEITCPESFRRGNISRSCDRTIGSQCSFACSDRYPVRDKVSFLTCLSDGKWDGDIDSLCNEIVTPPPESSPLTVYLAAGGAFLVIVIVVIIVLGLWCMRNRTNKSANGGNSFHNPAFCPSAETPDAPTGNDYCSLRVTSKCIDEEVYHELNDTQIRQSGEYDTGFIDRVANMDDLSGTRDGLSNHADSEANDTYLDVANASSRGSYLDVVSNFLYLSDDKVTN